MDSINTNAIIESSTEFLETLRAIKNEKHVMAVALFCNLKHATLIHPAIPVVLDSGIAFASECFSMEELQAVMKDADTLYDMQHRMRNSPS